MNRVTVFSMTNFGPRAIRCVALAAGGLASLACSGDTFTGFEGGATGDADPGDASADGDFDRKLEAGESDAPVTDAPADTPTEAYVCPTGVQACMDALALLCSRQKGCGAQTCDDMNTGTSGCGGKTICETTCLSDIQNASCSWINQHSVSPAFVSGNCGALW